MITVRKSEERGHANHGWLDAYHTFSFARYVDREHMNFRSLRVINEDRIAPGRGFDTHPHENMEIITYILDGELEHKDSLGNGSLISAGDIQRITAGSGIRHSEFNPSDDTAVHLLQIWITPDQEGLEPSYQQKSISFDKESSRLQLIVSKDGRDGSILINQDVDLFAARLKAGENTNYRLDTARCAWLQVAGGQLELNGVSLSQGDGAKIEEEAELKLEAAADSEILLFDLA